MSQPTRLADGHGHGLNEKLLFWGSFFTLIAAGIGFSVRGAILKDWGAQFGFTQSELGTITGGGLFGFGMTIIVLSFVADWIGYGKLMLLAFLLYVASAGVTFAASLVYANPSLIFMQSGKEAAYWCLFIGAWLFSLANGTCEAVINPLTATLFPNNKTHWLNILHAGWPGGLILGALITLGFDLAVQNKMVTQISWELKLGVFLAPVLLFGLMMVNRPFPQSEARESGVSVRRMMGDVGFLGIAVVVFFLGMLLSEVVLKNVPETWIKLTDKDRWLYGFGTAAVVWILYTIISGFKLGHIVLAILYVLHALVGYVELGTDSWITNIGNTVLNNQNYALGAFIWTNIVMFSLRFFAGPIVHKISPLGLLFVSALIGTAGLVLFSRDFIDAKQGQTAIILWFVVSTVYAVGKTYYWPTLLGVISERFPKGGALALGFSGGIGMLAAGLLGAPGIGYQQDYFAVQKITELSKPTYERYVARDDKGQPDAKGFPLFTDLSEQFKDKVPELAGKLPKVAGLDNAKLSVFDDYGSVLAGTAKETTLDADLATLARVKSAGGKVEPKLEEALNVRKKWWDEQGKPNYEKDKPVIGDTRLFGARQALLYTAAVPAAMAIGFLLLILIFMMMGGYKQVHIDEHR